MNNIGLFNDHFQNWKRYLNCKAQLIIADVPYNLGINAYASNPKWYVDGDNANGESELAGTQFFDTDANKKIISRSRRKHQRLSNKFRQSFFLSPLEVLRKVK